ncbi:twinfilin-1-like isoform X5 [Narcine bancroftii]|uniref:twinfilin-1-like isoform X5 n=1 Tax=Narcine bancroftii TaxID=1343680 RepID=UPI00383149B7
MTHQTGIPVSKELKDIFARARNGEFCVLKIVIENEQLKVGASRESVARWDQEYDSCILPLLDEQQPGYILYRMDTTNAQGSRWLFIAWSPDPSPVRQKMLYAATKMALKKEFGSSHIKDEIFGTVRDKIQINGETKPPSLQGVAFPMQGDVVQALKKLQNKELSYVQLKIDFNHENIALADTTHTEIGDLPNRVPKDSARYHFFLYKHSYEGDYLESIVFVYSMPGYTCSIRERMLYSSCKNPLIDMVEKQLSLDITKKPSTLGFIYNSQLISQPGSLWNMRKQDMENEQTPHDSTEVINKPKSDKSGCLKKETSIIKDLHYLCQTLFLTAIIRKEGTEA